MLHLNGLGLPQLSRDSLGRSIFAFSMENYQGYIILRNRKTSYKGVDGSIFEPELIENEFDPTNTSRNEKISSFYPKGWRRRAYQIFEDTHVSDLDFLITDLTAAREIVSLIPSGHNSLAIFSCEIVRLNHPERINANFGFDLAYLGGDFYSAIYNGLHCNPSPQLLQRWYVNVNGLFASVDHANEYVEDFKNILASEMNAEFWIYALSKP